jgi:hypothetical protein
VIVICLIAHTRQELTAHKACPLTCSFSTPQTVEVIFMAYMCYPLMLTKRGETGPCHQQSDILDRQFSSHPSFGSVVPRYRRKGPRTAARLTPPSLIHHLLSQTRLTHTIGERFECWDGWASGVIDKTGSHYGREPLLRTATRLLPGSRAQRTAPQLCGTHDRGFP